MATTSYQELPTLAEVRRSRGGINALAWCEAIGQEPHEGQRAILADQHRFKVIVCGARYGKSWSAARWAEARLMVPGARGWAVSGTYDLSDKVFREVVETFSRRRFIARLREDEHLLVLRNGSWLKAKSTDHPNSLDAEGLDFAVYDEAAKSPERILYQKLLPRLLDRRGELFAISTANGRNYYYDLFNFARSGDDAEYAGFNAPSWDNSKVFPLGANDPEIVRLRAQYEAAGMSALFMQEYGGSFAHLQGLVYGAFDPRRHIFDLDERAERRRCHRFIGGVDYGAANPSALTVWGQTGDGGYRCVEEWFQRGKTHDEIVAAMLALDHKWGVKQWWSDHEPALILAAIRGGINIENAIKGDIPGGCMVVASKMAQPNGFAVASSCRNLIREIGSYVWRESAQRGTIDEPVKKDDHACDSMRYAIVTEERASGRVMHSTRIRGL